MLTEILRAIAGQTRELPLSSEEKQFRLEQLLEAWPKITNPNLWVYLIDKVSSVKGIDGLTESDISAIVDTYKSTHDIGDIPVAQLVLIAFKGAVDLTRDKLLSGVCFNYDWEVDGEKRRDEEEAKETREPNWINKPQFHTLEGWVQEDIRNGEQMGYLKSKKVFKQGGVYLSEVAWDPANIFDNLEMTIYRMRQNFNQMELLLEPREIVKAGFEFNYYRPDKLPFILKGVSLRS